MNILESWRITRAHVPTSVSVGSIGAIPCVGAFVIMHGALDLVHGWRYWGLVAVLFACMAFSVRTVWMFGFGLFGERFKAVTLVCSLEGLMAFMPHTWLSMVACAALICINAVATACHTISQDHPAQQPTVTSVARELNVPRKAAARVVDRHLASSKSAARAAAT